MCITGGGDVAFVRVLGPIQAVTAAGLTLDLPSASQRRLLARLAVDAPRALRAELLCDVLAVSPGALRTIVSRMRRGIGGTAVLASQGRYRLSVPVDAAMFAAALSRAGAGEDRIAALERALALWTGPAFEEFAAEAWAEPEVARLAELHASAVEEHAGELILARRWAEAVAELRAHVSVHPLRDRPWGLLVQALGGAGRQADALAAYREYRDYLAEWVGTEPSAEVRRIQERIAAGWDGIDEPGRSASSRPAGEHGDRWLRWPAELAAEAAAAGRTRELELLAAEALERYEQASAYARADRVREGLRALGVRPGTRDSRRRPARGWESLTATERLISRLVAEGLTNRAVARRLHISPHTVNTHLRHVFAKLSVSNRAALASAVAHSIG